MKVITIKMEERLAEHLEFRARTEGRSVSDVVRRMVKESAITDTVRKAEISEEMVHPADIAEWFAWTAQVDGKELA
jgi:negative regulator of replication initiation